jgi:carbamoyl-phosphate synthase large subunit
MPKRTDLKTILLLGAGPIVIGQACEFDYSGVQACKALKEEGYRVVLINSNPATIMTDPELADVTYIEPIRWEVVAEIIEKERPDAILPTMGGQTALNCALDLAREGILDKFNVEMIGATRDAIDKAEDRERFRQAMRKIGLDMPRSAIAHSLEEALQVQAGLGFPTIIRPSFTLGGSGGGIAYNREEFIEICSRGLALSPTNELLLDESLIGWKEFELEVVRDKEDNCIIVCTIENLDAMGVHTGDSITVAPSQTLTDKEYQRMRDASIKVLREIGVDTGGSNVQFGMCPKTGRVVVIEMNPRVSRSSALASKATGFPIAKVAAKLAVGYTLSELKNEVTAGKTPASFEPTIDYVVTKIPRFNFEKFPQTEPRLTTQMKSVGEVMAIGGTFQESLQKAICSLEIGLYGLEPEKKYSELRDEVKEDFLRGELCSPGPYRLWHVAEAMRVGFSIETIYELSGIDHWFLAQIKELVDAENRLASAGITGLDAQKLRWYKQKGFSDIRLAQLLGVSETEIRRTRNRFEIRPVYKRVDTCSAEFATQTAYLYSTYAQECEAAPSQREKVVVLGGGPNRIGQGIEFDYCCVHAALAARELGYETIMINCNPETVSTDYDTSDRLYFEPLTLETVLEVIALEKPKGVIVQYGGQTPLKLARALEQAGVPILGTSPDAIDRAEDRERFAQFINILKLQQPPHRLARDLNEGLVKAAEIGYPLVVRPSYVLGGRAMEVVFNESELQNYLKKAVDISNNAPVLMDRFLDNAIEIDVDAVCDGKQVLIGGIMEHIEQAGVHSGDSACSLPAHSLSEEVQQQIREQMRKMALELGVIGLMNAQFALQDKQLYVLEVNPRASRTVPFVSKTMGFPLAKIALRCMLGISLAQQNIEEIKKLPYFSVKVPVFPFNKFPGVDPILGPEMRSTGEVMGVGTHFGQAFAKAELAAGIELNPGGRVFISVRDADKSQVVALAKDFIKHGFDIVATSGTAAILMKAGVPCQHINKVAQGRPHIVDSIKNNEIDFIVNTTEGKRAIADSYAIRRNALQHKVNYTTTIAGARAAILAFKYNKAQENVFSLQMLHENKGV